MTYFTGLGYGGDLSAPYRQQCNALRLVLSREQSSNYSILLISRPASAFECLHKFVKVCINGINALSSCHFLHLKLLTSKLRPPHVIRGVMKNRGYISGDLKSLHSLNLSHSQSVLAHNSIKGHSK